MSKRYFRIQEQIKDSFTDKLVKIHCKAEGPVSVSSIYHYVTEQHPKKVSIQEIEESIIRLKNEGIIELYDNDDQMKTYW